MSSSEARSNSTAHDGESAGVLLTLYCRMASSSMARWAPLPLRLIVGYGFAEHGFAGARIDRIAERAGANKRLLDYYAVLARYCRQAGLTLTPSRLLAIIILGGLGSVGGALGAAVFMITLESVVTIWYPTWAVAVFYAALVLVLVIRPNGFFGQKAVRAQ